MGNPIQIVVEGGVVHQALHLPPGVNLTIIDEFPAIRAGLGFSGMGRKSWARWSNSSIRSLDAAVASPV